MTASALLVVAWSLHPRPAAARAPASDSGASPAAYYLDNCAGCHNLTGEPGAGPNLGGLDARPAEEVRAAVARMEEYVGSLSDERVEALTALLRDPDLASRLSAGEAEAHEEAPEVGLAGRGEALFFGREALSGGGIACSGCHRAGPAGGTVARDLTQAHDRLGASALVSMTLRSGFPSMKAAYAARPVTQEEAAHLAAFLEEVSEGEVDVAPEPPVGWLGLGLGAVLFGALGLAYRRRRPGARAEVLAQARERRERRAAS